MQQRLLRLARRIVQDVLAKELSISLVSYARQPFQVIFKFLR